MFKLRFLIFWILILVALPLGGAFAQAENPDLSELVAGNNDFAFRLYHAVQAEEDGNLMLAPYSVSQAFAMAYAGARGSTESQMAEVMGFTLPQDRLHPTFAAFNADLMVRGNTLDEYLQETGAPPPIFSVANAFWGEQTFPFRQDYSDQMAQLYGAGLRLTDFLNQPEEARLAINDWVAENTNDRIKDIVPPGMITSNTKLALANAIYFKNFWLQAFNEGSTRQESFTLLDGSTVTVPMMHQTLSSLYYAGENYQGTEMDYITGNLTMTLIVPAAGQFEAFEESLDAARWEEILSNPSYDYLIDLAMPKFTFTYPVSLTEILKGMGMTDAFDSTLADFSGMADVSPDNPLWISQVLHKTFIGVDEHGTEAGGATVILGLGGGGPSETVEVRLDRPFIFAIRDRQTGALLFIGRVLNPLDEGEG